MLTMVSYGLVKKNIKNGHRVEVIPCPYEATTSYGKGTVKGPDAIIHASQELEFYDHELGLDATDFGIVTLDPVKMACQGPDTAEPFKALYDVCLDSYSRDKFPVVLGGEHSLSLGSVKAAYDHLASQGKGLTLLHFDAHADLRSSYQDNPYSHACAIYSIYKECPNIKITSVGIRNISKEECDWLENEKPNIKIFYAPSWDVGEVSKALSNFGNNDLYISFDVDAFDSGIMPATGTPEPGGLDWYAAINIIEAAAQNHNIVGADVVELAPIEGFHAADFLAAKLIYKIICHSVLK